MLLLSGLTVFSQNKYKPGYFIQNNGKRINCFISESDLNQTFNAFKYRLTASSPVVKILADSVTEVNIIDGIRYKWTEVPKINKRLFLNVLVSGEATLFRQDSEGSVLYFFKLRDSETMLLPPPESENHQDYITLLKSELLCLGLIDADFSNLTYSDSKLMTLFIRYNVCKQDSYVKLNAKKEYDLFNLYIKPGFSYNSMQVIYMHADMPFSVHFGHKPTMRFGAEIEFNMNILKNRTALIIDPSYNYFFADKIENSIYSKISYTSFEFPFGIRQYLSISPKSELFANVAYLADVGFNSDIIYIDYLGHRTTYDLNNVIFSYNFGVGYCWNKRLNVELRYNFQKELFPKEVYWQSNLSGFSLIVGYNIFK
ncbi:hypothetical protein ACE01N_07210 [Saccharicrinis sp. FJH2]|uniref:hypothetical protein n=1 Tax=Saccharicrinis sp. FJH65 TaxID=3344659 RepID=UPI0035F36D8A